MKAYKEMSKEELRALQVELKAQYEKLKEQGIKLDMSRGRPGADQLDLSAPMLDIQLICQVMKILLMTL